MVYLSKSKYCGLWQCPKIAWMKKYKPKKLTLDKCSDPKKLDLKEKQKHSCFSFFMQYFQAYIEPDFSNSI